MNAYRMDGHKLFWHLDRVAAWQAGELIAPIYVEISPVSFCNHRCVFCGLDFAHTDQSSLDTGLLRERIREMGRLGVRSIMFAGEGEPLLHKDLPVLVATAKSAGIDVSITTNGMTGTPELWRELLPHLSWLRFSIDAATGETYEKVHGVRKEFFEKTIESLMSALEVKKDRKLPVTIGVQYLLIRENLNDIEQAIRLYSQIGVDYLSFKPYSEHPQMLNKSGFNYSAEFIRKLEETVQGTPAGKGTTIIFRKTATAAYADKLLNFKCCRALPFWGYISSKGDFYTCSVYLNDDRFKAGNICEEGMESIFFGNRRRQSIEFGEHGLAIGEECRVNCRMARINEFLEFLSNKPEHLNFI